MAKPVRYTKEQFEKAQKALPKLRKAEALIKWWNDGLKAMRLTENADVLEVEQDDQGRWAAKTRPNGAEKV